MKYKYQNMKHVILHGILPGEIKEFDHPILGGGIRLVEEKKPIEKKTKKTNGMHQGQTPISIIVTLVIFVVLLLTIGIILKIFSRVKNGSKPDLMIWNPQEMQ